MGTKRLLVEFFRRWEDANFANFVVGAGAHLHEST
jgi:hypothetical protein